jgi:hypothetical protein
MCSVLRLMWLSVLEFLRLWIDSLNVVLFFGRVPLHLCHIGG